MVASAGALPEAGCASAKRLITFAARCCPCFACATYSMLRADPGKRENIVVVHYAGHRAGFVVDALCWRIPTVIQAARQAVRAAFRDQRLDHPRQRRGRPDMDARRWCSAQSRERIGS